MTERLEDEIEGFDFSKQADLIGKRSKPEPKEDKIDSEEEELQEILRKKMGKEMKPRSQEEVSKNIEYYSFFFAFLKTFLVFSFFST